MISHGLRPLLAVAAATLALTTILGGNPLAFAVQGPTWGQPQMTYHINAANLDLSSGAAEAAIRAGADAWHQASSFRFAYAGPSTQTTVTYDNTNLVLFRSDENGGAIATTHWWSNGSRIVDADIVFWDGAFRFYAGSSGCSDGFYIEDIAVHEFGHALGLGHSTLMEATMYPSTSSCNTRNRTLDADDISGVRALYPAAQPPRVPTRVRFVG